MSGLCHSRSVGRRDFSDKVDFAFRIAHQAESFRGCYIVAENNLLKMRPAAGIPVVRVCSQANQRGSIFLLQPGTSKWLLDDYSSFRVNGGVAFDELKWSGAPRARCIDGSPMAFAAAVSFVAKTNVPEWSAHHMDRAKFTERESVRLGKMEAH